MPLKKSMDLIEPIKEIEKEEASEAVGDDKLAIW